MGCKYLQQQSSITGINLAFSFQWQPLNSIHNFAYKLFLLQNLLINPILLLKALFLSQNLLINFILLLNSTWLNQFCFPLLIHKYITNFVDKPHFVAKFNLVYISQFEFYFVLCTNISQTLLPLEWFEMPWIVSRYWNVINQSFCTKAFVTYSFGCRFVNR